MAIEVFKLFGSIMVDNEKANKSISDTDKKAEGLGGKFIKGVGTAAKWGTAIVGAAGAGGAALFGMANKAAQATDRIDKMSQRLGMSREAFQKWDYVLSQNGVSIDSMQTAMKQFTKHMDGVNKGANANIDVYKRLDSSLVSLIKSGASQEEVFKQTVISFQNMEDGVEKARLAQELFGKQGQEMLPMLNASKGSVDELMKKAEELGLVMGDDAVDAGVKFTDTLDSLKRSFGTVVSKVGVSVMPIMQKFCDWIIANMPTIQAVIDAVFKAIEFIVSTVGDVLGLVFNNAKDNFGGFAEGISLAWEAYGQPLFDKILNVIDVVKNNWTVIMDTCKQYFTVMVEIIKGAWEGIGQPIFDLIMQVIGWVADAFAERMPQIITFFQGMVDDISNMWENNLKPCFDAIKNFIENVLAPAFEFVFKNIILPVVDSVFRLIELLWTNTLKPIFTGIIDFITGVFTGNWRKAFEGLGDIVSGVFNGLISIAKTPINAIIGMVNKMIGGLNELKIPDWVPIIGGEGVNIPEIPLLAKGTNYFKGGMAIVGEQGPELVEMPRGSKVNTASETKSMLTNGGTFVIQSILDGKVIAETIAPFSDLVGGQRLNLTERGLLV